MEDGSVACLLQSDRGVHVLGHRSAGEAADAVERRAAHDGRTPAERRRVQYTAPGLLDVMKECLIVPQLPPAAPTATILIGVDVVVVLRRLDKRDVWIAEVAEQPHKEIPLRDMVAIEKSDEIRGAPLQGVVEIAALGVLVARPCEIAAAQFLRKRPHLRSIPVVENPC